MKNHLRWLVIGANCQGMELLASKADLLKILKFVDEHLDLCRLIDTSSDIVNSKREFQQKTHSQPVQWHWRPCIYKFHHSRFAEIHSFLARNERLIVRIENAPFHRGFFFCSQNDEWCKSVGCKCINRKTTAIQRSQQIYLFDLVQLWNERSDLYAQEKST